MNAKTENERIAAMKAETDILAQIVQKRVGGAEKDVVVLLYSLLTIAASNVGVVFSTERLDFARKTIKGEKT